MLKPTYDLPDLPPAAAIETPAVLKALTRAHRYLAELKGRAATIPNQGILIDTLSLQEAKASSEIENIVTTQDELFQLSAFPENPGSPAAKEVARYRDALHHGFSEQGRLDGLLTNNMVIDMFRILKRSESGFREVPGTALKNEADGSLVYVPPQDPNAVRDLMTALERFINLDEADSDLDPRHDGSPQAWASSAQRFRRYHFDEFTGRLPQTVRESRIFRSETKISD